MFRTRHLLPLLVAALAAGVGAAAETPGTKAKGKPNRLAQESSPYLLQHAHNPVDWYPWGPEAFAKAKKEGKLVFLSIGYSSCHWCHVMERESFANPAVAAVLNEHFVCIKVDREERPDVDEVYMTALQEVLGLSGGWPLSMFLMPDGKPIFGGTYWPPDDRKVGDDTVDGFKTVLNRVVELNKTKPKDLAAQADKVAELTAEAMGRGARLALGVKLDAAAVKAAAEAFDIDPEHGGFGFKPAGYRGTKFPRAAAQFFLLQQSRKRGNDHLAKIVRVTLEKMAAGGIFDQFGGGFHRYSTERTWTVPHFEKMLYDNAQLLELYADAYRHDPNPEYRRVARQTTAFLTREMTSPEGTFYSALDADSEGREGAFYVWTVKDAAKVISDENLRTLATDAFGLGTSNFEDKFVIPTRRVPLAELAKKHKLTEDEVGVRLATARDLLFTNRSRRPRPFRDEKVLAGWNGLMIAGLARAGEVFREPSWVQTAEKAADFILSKMRTADGRLLRVYATRPGGQPEARIAAMLEDYAYVVHGLLNLHDATDQDRWLTEAKRLTEQMIRHHGDPDRGGFFTTPHDGEKLFARGKDYYDGATPSGNGMAARNLVRLWQKTKDERYRAEAERVIRLFGGVFHTSPTAAPLLTDALDRLLESGGLVAATPAVAPKAPAKPKQSADVVKLSVTAEKPGPAGEQAFTLTLTVAKPWHVYANPVGNPDLVASATTIEVAAAGKDLPVTVEYPDGQVAKDVVAGEYRVYEGTVRIAGRVKRGDAAGPLEVRVHVTACDDKTCLLPSVLTAELR